MAVALMPCYFSSLLAKNRLLTLCLYGAESVNYTEAAHLRKHLSRLDWMKAIDIAVQARERTEKSEYSDNDY